MALSCIKKLSVLLIALLNRSQQKTNVNLIKNYVKTKIMSLQCERLKTYDQSEKSDKAQFVIYVDIECLQKDLWM